MAAIKKTFDRGSVPMSIIMGFVLCIALSSIGALCIAILLESERIEETALGYGVIFVTLLSSFTGSFMALKMSKRFPLPIAFGVGAAYYAVLLAITALVFDGRYRGLGVTALIVVGSCACAILLQGRPKNRNGNRIIKYRNR
jgi:putative membrane protein (TIGR04086 family)